MRRRTVRVLLSIEAVVVSFREAMYTGRGDGTTGGGSAFNYRNVHADVKCIDEAENLVIVAQNREDNSAKNGASSTMAENERARPERKGMPNGWCYTISRNFPRALWHR